jgi:hypothetical protein
MGATAGGGMDMGNGGGAEKNAPSSPPAATAGGPLIPAKFFRRSWSETVRRSSS